jgi:hypothetical protein
MYRCHWPDLTEDDPGGTLARGEAEAGVDNVGVSSFAPHKRNGGLRAEEVVGHGRATGERLAEYIWLFFYAFK